MPWVDGQYVVPGEPDGGMFTAWPPEIDGAECTDPLCDECGPRSSKRRRRGTTVMRATSPSALAEAASPSDPASQRSTSLPSIPSSTANTKGGEAQSPCDTSTSETSLQQQEQSTSSVEVDTVARAPEVSVGVAAANVGAVATDVGVAAANAGEAAADVGKDVT